MDDRPRSEIMDDELQSEIMEAVNNLNHLLKKAENYGRLINRRDVTVQLGAPYWWTDGETAADELR